MTIDVGTRDAFYGPNAPSLTDLQDAVPGKQRWTVDVLLEDGQQITATNALHASFSHPDFGVFRYGLDASGQYDTVHWLDKGGSVKILYALLGGRLYIGLMLQSRPAQVRNQKVYEVPRGFREADEDPVTTARRELLEEVGLEVDDDSITALGVGSANNTFLLGCSMKFFGVGLRQDMLEPIDGTSRFRLTANALKDNVDKRYQRQKEGIEATELIPFSEAAQIVAQNSWQMGSMPMLSAITLLTFHLSRLGLSWQ